MPASKSDPAAHDSPLANSALPWPVERILSGENSHVLDGTNTFARSTQATDQGSSLFLDADTSGVQFAMYAFTAASPPLHVDIALDETATSLAWIGLADYGTKQWHFSGPFSSSQRVELSASNLSPLSNVYVTVLAVPLATAKINRLTLTTLNLPPLAAFSNVPAGPSQPLTMHFDASASSDPDGSVVKYEWDMDYDGTFESDGGASPLTQHDFPAPGAYAVSLRVTDDSGDRAVCSAPVELWASVGAVNQTGAGTACCLALVDGNPAVSYYDALVPNFDLVYVRATDPAGSTWGAPVVVDSAGDVGQDSSLQVVNGQPAIAYLDRDNLLLKYVRAADADGTSWGVPVTVDAVNATFGGGLAVVNGRPAVAYVGFDEQVRYVRATDVDGASWGAPLANIDDQVDPSGNFPCVTVVAGQPAICYQRNGSEVRYVRANDTDGASWPAAFTLDFGKCPVLAVANGNPAIAYVSPSGAIVFQRASDPVGFEWGVAVVVDASGQFNQYARLALASVGGRPALSYIDWIDADNSQRLMFTQSPGVDGTAWPPPLCVADPGSNAGSQSLANLADGKAGLCFGATGTASGLRFLKRP